MHSGWMEKGFINTRRFLGRLAQNPAFGTLRFPEVTGGIERPVCQEQLRVASDE